MFTWIVVIKIAYVLEAFGLQIIFIDGRCQDLYQQIRLVCWLIKKFKKIMFCTMHKESKYGYILEFDPEHLKRSTKIVITIYVHHGS